MKNDNSNAVPSNSTNRSFTECSEGHVPLCNTKRNHIVPQFYLKHFKDESGCVFLLDKKVGKISQTKNTQNIGCEKDVYSIKSKITDGDVQHFYDLAGTDAKNPFISLFIPFLVRFLNDEMGDLFSIGLRDGAIVDSCVIDSINEQFKKRLNNPDVSRNQELLFTMYESGFLSVYEEILRTKDIPYGYPNTEMTLLDYLFSKMLIFLFRMFGNKVSRNFLPPSMNAEEVGSDWVPDSFKNFEQIPYYDFLWYLAVQFGRSAKKIQLKKLDAEASSRFKEFEQEKGVRFNNVMVLFVHFNGIRLAHILESDKYKIILLENRTNTPFVTSDDPAVNPYAHCAQKENRKLEREEFEIFFPLSPNLALLCTKRDGCLQNERRVIDDSLDVQAFNEIIYGECDRFVYSNCKRVLDDLHARMCS